MLQLLQEIQDSLIAGLSPSRVPERIGGFLYLRHPSDPLKWLNQSLPVAKCSVPDVEELLKRYRETDRQPWLEIFPALCPEAVSALEAVGLERINEAPIMAIQRDDWSRRDYAMIARVADREDVRGGNAAAAEAFGSPEPWDSESTWKGIQEGRVLYSVGFEGQQIVASGQAIGTNAIREIAGVGTRPDWQRRGYGGAVINCLLQAHFSAGGKLAWLTPGDAGAESLYLKLGFIPVGTQAAYGLPA